ncbi:phosphoglycerate mutase family protein [Kushneria sp. AK178]
MKIILMRHGAPQVRFDERMVAADFRDWVARYQLAGLDELTRCERAFSVARECAAVVCSDLPRSLESALRLEAGNIVYSDPLMREIDLPHGSGRWPTPPLPTTFWLVTFRALWLLGYHGNAEGRRAVFSRAGAAASKLVELAGEHCSVLFVGHGMINHLLARELLSRGWQGPRRPGRAHWQYGVYEYQGQAIA